MYKPYACAITRGHLKDAVFNFQEEPSADNWIKLERAMQAHQKARYLTEDELHELLNGCQTKDVFKILVNRYNEDMERLEEECLQGNVRLIRADVLKSAVA